MQLEGNYYYDVTIISLEISNSIVHTLIIQYILFAMFLTALGTFILAISILFKSSVYGFIGLAIFLQNGHNAILIITMLCFIRHLHKLRCIIIHLF